MRNPKIIKKFLIAVGLLTLGLDAKAGADFELSTYYRSEPVGGAVEGELGFSQRLWGFSANKTSSPWFGYVRPFAGYTQIEDYSASYGGVDLFPVSLVGGRIMSTAIENSGGYEAYDCTNYLCDGEFREDRIQGFLLVPIGSWFFTGTLAKDRIASRGTNRAGVGGGLDEYILPNPGLPAANQIEDFIDRDVITFGYRVGDRWTFFAQRVHWRVRSNELEAVMGTVGVGYKLDYFDFKISAGRYRSDLADPDDPSKNRREDTVVLLIKIPILDRDGYF